MKKLVEQIVKFGLVGVICTLIDFACYTGCNLMGIPYLISGIVGFVVSVIFNYILSMRYVFARREDISRKKEFIVFIVLSVIGLILNEFLLYICVDLVYMQVILLQKMFNQDIAQIVAKLCVTVVVMIYNFVSRKLILEKKAN